MTEKSSRQIEERAYELYLARGSEHGRDLDDWLAAEQELQPLPLAQGSDDAEFEQLLSRNALAFSATAVTR